MARFVRFPVFGGAFETPTRYTELEPLNTGVSCLVCSARDQIGHQFVAIKKISDPFGTASNAQNTFREIKLLKHLRHDNIINLVDIFISPSEDIYLVMDLMPSDLQTLLKAKPIESEFVQFFLYQMTRGLKYIHSAGVVHRDLAPWNILINENCDVKICDFGLARVQEPHMTGNVPTSCYRAPEIILAWQSYDEQGHAHQFCVITEVLGTPPRDVIAKITTPNTLSFIESLPKREAKPLSDFLPSAGLKAIDLLERTLVFDPHGRISASEALASPYLAPYHDPTDEPVAEETFDWTFNELDLSDDAWKSELYADVLEYYEKKELQESVKRWILTSQ